MNREWDSVRAAGYDNPLLPKERKIGNRATTPIAKKDLKNAIRGLFGHGQ